MKYVAHTYIGRRENNEDCCAVLRFKTLSASMAGYADVLVLSDGMGGLEYGERVSIELVKTVNTEIFKAFAARATLQETNDTVLDAATLIPDLLADTLLVANQRARRMIEQNGWGDAGATLVACIVYEATVFYIHLGDSRFYRWDAAAQALTQLTSDHTVAQVLLDKGLISPEMARHHAQRNNLVFYIGCEDLPATLNVGTAALQPGDRLLLCSDGISGDLDREDLEPLFQTDDLQTLGTALVQTAMDAESSDNMTLILYEHDEDAACERVRLDTADAEAAYRAAPETVEAPPPPPVPARDEADFLADTLEIDEAEEPAEDDDGHETTSWEDTLEDLAPPGIETESDEAIESNEAIESDEVVERSVAVEGEAPPPAAEASAAPADDAPEAGDSEKTVQSWSFLPWKRNKE